MRHSRLIWLIALGALLFAIGLFVPFSYYYLRATLLIAGAALGFLFYLYTLIEVLKSKSLRQSRKIFWMVVIVCVPVFGNLIYIVMQDSMSHKQTPRLQNF